MNHEDKKKGKGGSATSGVSRRGFLTSVSTGAIGAAAVAKLGATAPAGAQRAAVIEGGEVSRISIVVNGRQHRMLVEPRWSLLHVLRDKLGLTGTKVGCERGECGACTVLVDGKARYACMTLAVEADGYLSGPLNKPAKNLSAMLAINREVTPNPNDIPSTCKRKNSREIYPRISSNFNPSKMTPARILFLLAAGAKIHLMPKLSRRKFTPINNPPNKTAFGSSICPMAANAINPTRSRA